jgi:hypothetical protein
VSADIHPEGRLAEYVEGTLDPAERAGVEDHLGRCDRCRGEVDLAREARAVLGGLPELEAPAGLGMDVRRRARAGRAASPVWRVVAPVAAAAVLIAGGFVVIRSLGDGAEQGAGSAAQEGGAGGGDAEGGAPPASEGLPLEGEAADASRFVTLDLPRYSRTDDNYNQAGLVVLARGLRDEARATLDRGLARTADSFYSAFKVASLPGDLRPVYRCVVAEVPPDQLIVPFTILEASFEDEPAYIASFLQGPAPDQPYDRLVIWVVGRDDCGLRSLASQRL